MKKLFFGIILVFLLQYFFYVKGIWGLYVLNKAILILIGIVIFYIFVLLALKNRMYPYTFYFFFWFSVLDISSAISALLHFGQPLLYGLIAQVKLFAFTFYFITLLILNKFRFSYRTIEDVFIKVAVSSLIVFYIVALFFKGILEGTEFLKYDVVRGWRLNLPLSVVVIGYFYYLYCFLLFKRKKCLLFPLTVLLFLVFFEKSRMMTIGVLIITVLILLRSNLSKKMKLSVITIACVSIIYGLTKINVQDLLFHSSLAIRLLSVKIILGFIEKGSQLLNFLFGVGGLNPIFFRSFQSYFGQNFWPSDVGLLGIFFEFGALGIIFAISLWIVLLREINRAKLLLENAMLINAFESYVYLSIFLSPLNPMIIYQLGVFSTMLGILVYLTRFYYRKQKDKLLEGVI